MTRRAVIGKSRRYRVRCACGRLKEPYSARCWTCRFGVDARASLEERFWAKVRRGESCWEWTGSRTHGYGVIWTGERTEKAHRVSWKLAGGTIPEGMEVCHHCDNPPCVRPDHLFVGTRSANMQDRANKGRHHMQLPLRGDRWAHARLSPETVRSVRELAGTLTQQEVADRFGISRQYVSDLVLRKAWDHLP